MAGRPAAGLFQGGGFMRQAIASLFAVLCCAEALGAQACVREGKDKAREIMSGVAGSAAASLIIRTVTARPHRYPDYRTEYHWPFSPKYNRRMMASYAVGSALGIFIATPRRCRSLLRPLPGVIVPTIPFWGASEKPFGMVFSSMFLPPFQAAGGTLTNGLKR
jgi:hypothetical protein